MVLFPSSLGTDSTEASRLGPAAGPPCVGAASRCGLGTIKYQTVQAPSVRDLLLNHEMKRIWENTWNATDRKRVYPELLCALAKFRGELDGQIIPGSCDRGMGT